jgi:polyhydroxybutyrate depolymerase
MVLKASLIALALGALGCSSTDDTTAKPGKDAGSTDGGSFGGSRPVTVRVPAGYDAAKPAPLVILLHGYGVSGLVQDIIFHTSGYADTGGYFFAAPDGTVDSQARHFWNATDDCCDYDGSGVDDVGYLKGLIHEIEGAYAIDPKRVYLIGHSNGGYMAHRMACDDAVDVAAIVSVAGATFQDQTKCNPSGPVNVLEIHGDADPDVLYDGSTAAGDVYPGAVETVNDWAAKNGCLTPFAKFPACPPGGDVELWTIHGGGHVPNWDPSFPSVVWQYFDSHAKP